jgi:hypothetical protein
MAFFFDSYRIISRDGQAAPRPREDRASAMASLVTWGAGDCLDPGFVMGSICFGYSVDKLVCLQMLGYMA